MKESNPENCKVHRVNSDMSTPPTAANIGAALVAADALFPFESAEAHEMTRVLATGAKAYDRLAQII
jgi:hypothetical protein